MDYQSRWQEKRIRDALKVRRVIVLAGPRQCGKTVLSQVIVDADSHYRNLDERALLQAAVNDPETFIKHDGKLMVIDEVQRAPELLLAIKSAVDRNPVPGQYLLTGSSHIRAQPRVRESLAGRARRIRLRPFSVGEREGTEPIFLKNAFAQDISTNGSLDRDDYIVLALAGGYPEPLKLSQREAQGWYLDYIESLFERDLRDIINIRRRDALEKLLQTIAAYSSKQNTLSDLSTRLSIKEPTVVNYINALEALYLVERARPWVKSDYSQIAKKDKLFMSDTGLMATALKWDFKKIRLDGDKVGKLIETFVYTQLMATLEAQEETYELYFYRDRAKHEIDFIIENKAGDFLGIEVKAGSSLKLEHFKNLQWFAKRDGLREFVCRNSALYG